MKFRSTKLVRVEKVNFVDGWFAFYLGFIFCIDCEYAIIIFEFCLQPYSDSSAQQHFGGSLLPF